MTNVYSLADVQAIIKIPDVIPENVISLRNLAIGGPGEMGEGSFVGSITITRTSNLFSTTGDSTGSWTHNKNLDRTGSCNIAINQISDTIVKLAQLCNAFESIQGNYPGMTISIVSSANDAGMPIAICEDCYITKIPDQGFAATAATQVWVFTCGRITMYPSA